MPATRSIPRAPNSTATCRSASPPPPRTCCSSGSNSTGSTTPSSTRRWPDPALGHYRPWLEDIRKDKPYQLEDRVEQLFHEKSVTAYSAWNRLFDETIASLRFKVGKKSLAIEPTLNLHAGSERDDPQGRGAGARQDLQGQPAHLRADHQHRSPRTRKSPTAGAASPTWRDARHLSNRVEPEVVDALVAAVRAAYPRLSHRYYALKARWFGKKRLAHWDRNAPLPKVAEPHHRLERGAVDRAHRLWRVLDRHGGDRRAVLQEQLDRCAGAARQGARRLRASDRAVGAPLRAAQLPGQAARRDDARARARPRRASGAGGAERRADGADAADAGRDRERVRRDADLPASCSPAPTRSSARRCSPPRSRT